MAEASRPGTTALIIDDSASARSQLAADLRPLGFECLEAEDGCEGIRILRSTCVDIVFLDIEMPKLDGPSTLRVLRASGHKLPVVLLTGADTRKVASVIRLGATDYLAKPPSDAAVHGVLERIGALRAGGKG